MTSRRRFTTTALLASAITLAACGGGSDDGSAAEEDTDTTIETVSEPADTEPESIPTEPAPVATEPAPVATEPAPEPVETTPAPVATEPVNIEPAEPESGADGSCLIGEWVLTSEEMNGYYDAIETSIATNGPAPSFDIDGDVLLTFGETDYTYIADFDLTLAIAGQTGTGVTKGTVTGTWDVVDDLIVTTPGSSDLDVVVTVSGVTISGSDLANGILNSAPINNAPFDCAGPTIGFQINESDGPRHDVLLTPA